MTWNHLVRNYGYAQFRFFFQICSILSYIRNELFNLNFSVPSVAQLSLFNRTVTPMASSLLFNQVKLGDLIQTKENAI